MLTNIGVERQRNILNLNESGKVMASLDLNSLFTNVPVNFTKDLILKSVFLQQCYKILWSYQTENASSLGKQRHSISVLADSCFEKINGVRMDVRSCSF